jgi:hypothetical protein
MGELKRLMIHCTASIDGQQLMPGDIERMHMGARMLKDGRIKYKGKEYKSKSDLPKEKIGGVWASESRGRGWSKVGYSKMVGLSGSVYTLSDYNEDNWIDSKELTYGAAGMNSNTRHFVYVGGVSKNYEIRNGKKRHYPEMTLNEAQEKTLVGLIQQEILRKPDLLVCGHNQHGLKACPSFDTSIWLEEMGFDKKNISYSLMKVNLRSPFEDSAAGNKFREWVNDNFPNDAKEIDLDRNGSHRNNYIIRAWYRLRHEYSKSK